jgi:hypothetical protein
MLNHKNEKLIALFCFLVLGILLVSISTVCKRAEKKAPERLAISLDMLVPIFGDPKDAHSGVVDINQSDKELTLAYHFDTQETSDFDDDIGRDLAPKIRDFYKKFPQIDRVVFGVFLPSTSEETGWKSYVTFVVTKKLVTETDWTKLLDDDFLKAALEVKYVE